MPLETCASNPFAVGNITADSGSTAVVSPTFSSYLLDSASNKVLITDFDGLGNQYTVGRVLVNP